MIWKNKLRLFTKTIEVQKQRADKSLPNRSSKYFKHDKYPADNETVGKGKISEK